MISTKIEKTLDVCYNLDYLVIVPIKNKELFEDFNYTFGNALLFENSVEDTEFLIEFLKKNIIGQLIFVDYYEEYNEVISTLIDEHKIKFIFTKSLGELSNEYILGDFEKICERYDRGEVEAIGFLDPYLYKVMWIKWRKANLLLLDTAMMTEKGVKNEDTIGLLGASSSDYCSFYNEMSSLSLLGKYKAKVCCPIKEVVDFAEEYGVQCDVVDSFAELASGNICNLDVNFAGALATNFIKSMDKGIPCVVGNNSFLSDDYPTMKKHLVVESDDDVNEIAEKVKTATMNKKAIMKEYNKFRSEYSKKAKSSVRDFLGFEIGARKDVEYEKLLTVVVPVYNTAKYLANCLDSIIAAKVPDMEILVINDGSTDDSDEVAREYVGKYPDMIRYIKQKNCGLGNVRNVGIEQSRGKYLASVDSDDTIENEFFREALPYLKDGVDVVICDWMSVTDEKNFETAALDWVFEKRKKMEGLLYTTIMPSTCNKIFKKSLFLDNNVKYLEQKYEDLSANPLVLLKAETVKYIHKPYYNYYLRDNSLMRSKINPRQMVDALSYLDKKLKIENEAIDLEEFKYYTYAWRIEEYIINPLYKIDGDELEEEIKYIHKKIHGIIGDVFENKYYKKMLKGLKSTELRRYIEERNAMFNKKRLKDFITSKKSTQELSAGIIYYGD